MQAVTSPAHRRSSTGVPVPLVLGVALIVSLAIWAIPGANVVLVPVRPYVTFVHEGWHAFVAIATGGHVGSVRLFGIFGGGVTELSGGATLLIASAGYVGSAITGAVFLFLLPRPRALRVAVAVQYMWLAVVAVLWDHDLNAWLYLIGFGLVLYVLAAKLPDEGFALVMGFLALQLALAVVGDLRTLLLISAFSAAHSDALVAAQATSTPRIIWATLWSIIALALLLWALRSALAYPRGKGRPASPLRTR